ncbi:MAG: hypothetical protein HYR48_07820 [Gemmatimonadetes bacterium]|nr:hypothetical protein [Gemmatimonadota bacterium]
MWPLAGSARAQQAAVVQRDNETFLSAPGGTRLGRIYTGSAVTTGRVRSGHTETTLEGWVFGRSLQPAARDGHTLAVARSAGENLRQSANGRVLARLVQGCLLDEVERRGEWVHVRRTGWVASDAFAGRAITASATRADTTAAQTPPPATEEVDPRRAFARRRLQLYRAPDAAPSGVLEAGVPVRITARAGPWVRVEAQGWVRENEIRLSDSGILTGVSAAELRAEPDEFRGKLLRWTIQFIALQTADELRPDFTPGQKYILARGPAPEYAFVYVVVPPGKLDEISRLEPLARVDIVARVVNGRSAYLANPILELVDISQ